MHIAGLTIAAFVLADCASSGPELQPNVILVDDRVADGVGPVEIARRLQSWAPYGNVVLLTGPATWIVRTPLAASVVAIG